MPSVVLARRAVQDLDAMIASHSLPRDTRRRVARVLEPLGEFPRLGRQLEGRWLEHRVLPGPWRWMLLVHRVDEENDQVVVVTIQDGRSAASALGDR